MVDKSGRMLKDYHHITIDAEFRSDCTVWHNFLCENPEDKLKLCRPFLDWNKFETSTELRFYSDASGKIGFGAIFDKKWLFGQ